MKELLKRPIVFFDTETTGVDVETDRIVEIAVCKIMPDGNKLIKTQLFNPEMPIPSAASDVHGITDEMVKDAPTFKQKAKGIHDFIEGCDLAGYNSNVFDIPLLYNEFTRSGIDWDYSKVHFIDVFNIYKINHPRTLSEVYRKYTGNILNDAHSAEADILATVEIFEHQLNVHELPYSVPELALYSNYDKPVIDLAGKFTTDENGVILLNFGKSKGQPAHKNIDFLQWMLKGNFSNDTLKIARRIISESRYIVFLLYLPNGNQRQMDGARHRSDKEVACCCY